MHEVEFSRAVLPPVRVVFGLRLRPYSLGHELFLIRENNPVLTGGIPDRRSVAEAALICSSTWRELQSPPLFIRLYIALWRWRTRRCNEFTEFLKFQAYRSESLYSPPTYPAELPRGTQVRMTGTPFILTLLNFVRANHPECNPFDYPMALARWEWLARQESEGSICIESEYDAHIKRLSKGEFSCPA